jgi:hypothetical protein
MTKERNPVFSWTAVAGVTSYQARLLDSDDQTVASATALSGTTWTPSATLAPGDYRLWLKAIDFRGNSLSTEEYFFRVVENDVDVESPQLVAAPDLAVDLLGLSAEDLLSRASVQSEQIVAARIQPSAEQDTIAAAVESAGVTISPMATVSGSADVLSARTGAQTTEVSLLELVFEQVAAGGFVPGQV